jgi:hypothetical protein
MANKYFYFIKLKDGFYDIPEIKVLLSYPCGYAAVTFLQKLMLEARNHDGYLRLNQETPYTVETLCPVIHFPTDLGRECEKALAGLGLIKWMSQGEHDGDLYIPMTADCIGSESDSTIRSRKSREDHSQEEAGIDPPESKKGISNKTATAVQRQCNGSATTAQRRCNSPFRTNPHEETRY